MNPSNFEKEESKLECQNLNASNIPSEKEQTEEEPLKQEIQLLVDNETNDQYLPQEIIQLTNDVVESKKFQSSQFLENKDDCKKIIPLDFDYNWKSSKVPSEMIHTHVEKLSLVPKLENLFRSIVAVNLAISARNLFKVINKRSMKKDNLDASHKFKVLDCIMKMSTLNKKKISPFDR